MTRGSAVMKPSTSVQISRISAVESCGDDGSGVVGTATTEVRNLVGVAVFAYKIRNKRNALQVAEGATHKAVCQFGVESVLMISAARS